MEDQPKRTKSAGRLSITCAAMPECQKDAALMMTFYAYAVEARPVPCCYGCQALILTHAAGARVDVSFRVIGGAPLPEPIAVERVQKIDLRRFVVVPTRNARRMEEV